MLNLLIHEELDLFYRGNRDYVYGPDLFDKAIKCVFQFLNTKTINEVDFSSHGMTRFGLDFYLFDIPQDEINFAYHSKVSFKFEGKKYYGYLVNNAKEITVRIPYPEEQIIEVSELNSASKSITIKSKTSFLITDNYTALTKSLHYRVFPEIVGKWIFVRVVYPEYHEDMNYESLKVQNRRMFANKYTQNTLLLNGEEIGKLYFSLI